MKVNNVNILTRQWQSLSQLKEYLEKNSNTQIISFSGWRLETSIGTFTLTPEGIQKDPP